MSMRSLAPKILLSIGTLVITLLVLECALRARSAMQDHKTLEDLHQRIPLPPSGEAKLGHLIRRSQNRRIIYELLSDVEAVYQGGRIALNQYGFRGPEVSPGSHEGVFRIVGIGDSFMFGQGVSEGEPYLAVLQNRCFAENTAPPVEVVNLAVPGYNTAMEIAAFKEKGLRFQPNLVIIDFVGNDITLPNFLIEQPSPWDPNHLFLLDFLSRVSRESTLHGGAVSHLDRQGLTGVPKDVRDGARKLEYRHNVPPQYRDMIGWEAYRTSLKELQDLGSRFGFDVFVISLVATHSREIALGIATELGIQTIDVATYLRDYLGTEKYLGSALSLSSSDGHPSTLGHRMIGDILFEYLVDHNFVAIPESSIPLTAGSQ